MILAGIFLMVCMLLFLEVYMLSKNPILSLITSVFLSLFLTSLFVFVQTFFLQKMWLLIAISLLLICFTCFVRFKAYKNTFLEIQFAPSIYTVLLLLGLAFIVSNFQVHLSKWGRWDAIAIWNLHAFFLAGSKWHLTSSPSLSWSHFDYPLYLPASIVFFWEAIGEQNSVVPFLLSFFATLAIPFTLFATLPKRSILSSLIALLFSFLLWRSATYLQWGFAQCADIFVALGILLSVVFYQQFINSNKMPMLFLSFMIAAINCWTKNEAIFYFLALSFVFILNIQTIKSQSIAKYFVYTSMILFPLGILAVFKLQFASTNDLVGASSYTTFSNNLFAVNRYKIIAFSFFETMMKTKFAYFIGMAYIVAFFTRSKGTSWLPILILSLVYGCYFFIYVLTPKDLAWHLETSLPRLLLQLLPASIFSLLSVSKK